MKPVVDRLSQSYAGRVEFMVYSEVNSDAEASRFASEHGVTAIPTMMLVDPEGVEVERLVGAVAEDDLASRLDALVDR